MINAQTTLQNSLWIKDVKLAAFRSYPHFHGIFSPEPVVLLGDNGAGKTNFLEALSFLAPGKGLRKADLADIRQAEAVTPWGVHITLQDDVGEVPIGVGQGSDPEQRILHINDEKVTAQNSLLEWIRVIWLTPPMDTLFLSSATMRRKFLDKLVGTYDPSHVSRLYQYDHAQRERAHLLRSGRLDNAWLQALEMKMAETGVAIVSSRQTFLDELAHTQATSLPEFPKWQAVLTGIVEERLESQAAVDVEAFVMETLKKERFIGDAYSVPSVGPHASQFTVRHLGKNLLAAQCSTGEQKILLVGLILAHTRLIRHYFKKSPLLLLDDVVAHLDPERRSVLYNEITTLKIQAWFTGTERHLFAPLWGQAQFFRVQAGKLEQES